MDKEVLIKRSIKSLQKLPTKRINEVVDLLISFQKNIEMK